MADKKFSKSIVAKFIYNFRLRIIEKYKINYNDGTHQLEKHFNDKLIDAIKTLKLPSNGDNFEKVQEASKYVHEVINNIIAYGKKEMCEIVSMRFDLNEKVIEMAKKGESLEDSY